MAEADVATPLRGLLEKATNVQVLLGEVVDLDPANRELVFNDRRYRYDHLILATGSGSSYFGHEDWRAEALATVARELAVPLAVRTAARKAGGYRGRYEGDQRSRDLAYHNGTAWPFLLGLLLKAESHAATGPSARLLRDARGALADHLRDGGLGSISEIVDADAPFEPRGCPMQAWSVGLLLEALRSPAARRIDA